MRACLPGPGKGPGAGPLAGQGTCSDLSAKSIQYSATRSDVSAECSVG